MKTQYFKINWQAINKAIPDNLKELRQAQKELEKKIQKKVNDYYRKQKELKVAEKITELKDLPMYSDVYYIGRGNKIKFGERGRKIQDKRTNMLVEFNGVNWNCPYVILINRSPTDQEIRDNKLGEHFNKVLSNIKW